MILSTNCSSKAARTHDAPSSRRARKAWDLMLLGFFCFTVVAHAGEMRLGASPVRDTKSRIAMFPVENLSATTAPLEEIRQGLIDRLNGQGFQVLGDEALETFMAKHRIRFVGGVDRGIAKAFKEEIGIEAVLIVSLEFYSETDPPKVALTSRLISTGEAPSILWTDGVGLAGDDSPGILGLGLIEDPKALLEKAVKSVTDSLIKYLLTGEGPKDRAAKTKFRPKVVYRSPELDPGKRYVVAVLPFFNRSERKYAGEILVLRFIDQLRKFKAFDVVEPGILRQELLGLRVIMEDGVSLANADAIFSVLDADIVVSGRVIEYQDYQGFSGKPKVDFSTIVIERKSREVVWGSDSYNEGDDGVFFFDTGRVNTAYVMASQMVRWIAEGVTKPRGK